MRGVGVPGALGVDESLQDEGASVSLGLRREGDGCDKEAQSSQRGVNLIAVLLHNLLVLVDRSSRKTIRVPCSSGICTTPMQITSSQLVASDIIPVASVKALLFPGAIAHELVKNVTVPSWNNLLDIYNLMSVKKAPVVVDLKRLEVLAGSYFCVAGAFIGLLKPGRMSMFGTLLVVWGLVKEGFLGQPVSTDPDQAVYVYPTMLLAVVCAFASVKYNVKKAMRASQLGPLQNLCRALQNPS